jgi:uncharacterized protein (DUF2236 family)
MSVSADEASGVSLLERAAAAFAGSVPVSPADDGFFGPGSVTWRLAGALTMPVVGLRALLLQALHPLAMAGVDQHSQWRSDPGARLESTSAYEVTISFGDRAAALAAAARVRNIHGYVRGIDPATGKAYAAQDPALLLWVHNALVDSQLACARRYGSITPDEEDRYVGEQAAAAELIGIPAGLAPGSAADLAAYFGQVRPELRCTPAAAATTGYLLRYLLPGDVPPNGPHAPVPAPEPEDGGLWEDVARAAIASLPGWAIDLYGDVLPAAGPAPARAEVRAVLGVMDAAFLSEPGVLEARQRIQARIRRAARLLVGLSAGIPTLQAVVEDGVVVQVQRFRDGHVPRGVRAVADPEAFQVGQQLQRGDVS